MDVQIYTVGVRLEGTPDGRELYHSWSDDGCRVLLHIQELFIDLNRPALEAFAARLTAIADEWDERAQLGQESADAALESVSGAGMPRPGEAVVEIRRAVSGIDAEAIGVEVTPS